MPTLDEVAKQPLEQRLDRMARTADDLAAAIAGQSEAALVRRPDLKDSSNTSARSPLRSGSVAGFIPFVAG